MLTFGALLCFPTIVADISSSICDITTCLKRGRWIMFSKTVYHLLCSGNERNIEKVQCDNYELFKMYLEIDAYAYLFKRIPEQVFLKS